MLQKLKMLDLFSGIGGFSIAAQNAGIEIIGHSEIDTKADAIYAKHFSNPNYGDITKIVINDLPDFDLLVFGSPCQDLSISNTNRQGLDGIRSGLFYNAVDILQAKKPKFFIMENVNSMNDENKNIISNILGVQPIMISSALVSAQNRKRLYWVGRINDNGMYETVPVTLPEDMHIYLSDIMEKHADEKYYLKNQEIILKRLIEKHSDKMENIGGIVRREKCSSAQADIIYDPMGKSSSLMALAGGLGGKTGLYLCMDEDGRNDNLTFRMKTDDGMFVNYTFSNVRIRRLTPLETERLQGFPDNYTSGFSDSVRYKGTGNAITVPVIEHILKFLPNIA